MCVSLLYVSLMLRALFVRTHIHKYTLAGTLDIHTPSFWLFGSSHRQNETATDDRGRALAQNAESTGYRARSFSHTVSLRPRKPCVTTALGQPYKCHGCTFPAETHCHHTTDAVRKVSTGRAGRQAADTPPTGTAARAGALSLRDHISLSPPLTRPLTFHLSFLTARGRLRRVGSWHRFAAARVRVRAASGVTKGDGSSALMAGQLPEDICQPGRGWPRLEAALSLI